MTLTWASILVLAGGCYALKLAGLSVPQQVLDSPKVRSVAVLLPVALLGALTAVQTFSDGRGLVIDARAAGVAAAAIALLLRAPFLLVIVIAAAVAAAIRAMGVG